MSMSSSPVNRDGPIKRYGHSSSNGSRAWPRVPSDVLRFVWVESSREGIDGVVCTTRALLVEMPDPVRFGDRPRSLPLLRRGRSGRFRAVWLYGVMPSRPSSESISNGGCTKCDSCSWPRMLCSIPLLGLTNLLNRWTAFICTDLSVGIVLSGLFVELHTTAKIFPRFLVMAVFISSSVGGSTMSAVFSSSESSGSVPRFVTQG